MIPQPIYCSQCRLKIGEWRGAWLESRQPTRYNPGLGALVIVCGHELARKVICRAQTPVTMAGIAGQTAGSAVEVG